MKKRSYRMLLVTTTTLLLTLSHGLVSLAGNNNGDFVINSAHVQDIKNPNYLYDSLQDLSLDDDQVKEFIKMYTDGESKSSVLKKAEKKSKENLDSEKSIVEEFKKLLEKTSADLNKENLDKLKNAHLKIKYTNVNKESSELTKLEEKFKTEDAKRVKETEEKKKADEEQKKESTANKNSSSTSTSKSTASIYNSGADETEINKARENGTPYFGSDGLLVMSGTGNAQQVVNLLLGIPGHANGKWYHQTTGLDDLIDTLSVEEATWVLWRCEGAGFGQTASGWAGVDSTASHQAFLDEQIHKRFKGSIHELLRQWGTFEWGGY